MNKYVTRISQVYSGKNKLEKAIQDFITQNDRLLIDSKDLKKFKESIIQHINFLNQEFKNCTPKSASWFDAGQTRDCKDYGLSGIECVAFYIHEIKNEYVIENSKS
ncbi:hypothetical protein ACFQO9_04660 [Chryseobacterium zhengzhouense]|uniref:Uncharacterized protein n=1 Tax=Chryseobacterium zhengzhouense TaxID=1636086 RepID=A0ABW2LXM3_9FLAO